MVEPQDKSQYLSDLLMLVLDGSARPEHYVQLNEMLRQSEANRRIYMEFMTTYVGLNYFEGDFIGQDSDVLGFDMDLWQKMSDYEKTAPTTEIPKEEPAQELPQRVVYPPREKYKMSRFSQIFLVMNAAAILFFILLLKLTPPSNGIEVATLSDSINAKWADVAGSMEKGVRLTTRSDELFLREGIVELLFDNHAKVVIEGPAGFELFAENQINLRYGRIYATVPHEAIGFTVNTSTSRIIDLGTEFGVQTDPHGDVYLHVIKGKTMLFAGDRSNKVNLEVTAGHAKKVSSATQEISDIPCETERFVRSISSDHKYIWRGQTEFDLADVIGGGNGFGTGQLNQWIDALAGKRGTRLATVKGQTVAHGNVRVTDNQYHVVPSLSYVDGAFSPDGGTVAVQVTSKGDVWEDCPDTSGIMYEDIYNGSKVETSLNRHALILQGQVYGSKEKPAIALHSNVGITFDLDAIRTNMPGLEITQFRSLCGVSTDEGVSTGEGVSTDEGVSASVADFWVLVDGKKRFESLKMKADTGPREVTVPLAKEDRYLTLVVTDSDLMTNYDWGFFAMPRLEIKNAK